MPRIRRKGTHDWWAEKPKSQDKPLACGLTQDEQLQRGYENQRHLAKSAGFGSALFSSKKLQEYQLTALAKSLEKSLFKSSNDDTGLASWWDDEV